MSTLKNLSRDKSGQVAILFALSIIPIVAVAGFAIDFQQTVKRKAKVQLVMDSAVLAAARVKQTGATNEEIKLTVQQFMDAQIGGLGGLSCDPTSVVVSDSAEEIDASILCEQTTALIKVVGRDQMPFRVSSASEYGIDKVDVAFMFDVSGSMNSSNRLINLKAAAIEAIDVLLPDGASPELIEDTRLAMVSYNSMVNAGEFFPDVAGVPATRTYEHTVQPLFTEADLTEGNLYDEMHIGLYDTDTGNLISEIGDGAKIKIEDWQDDDLTIAVTLDPSHDLYGQVDSMRMQLRGTEYKNKTENGEPYALYGGSGIGYGQAWDMGDFTIRLRAYSENYLDGTKLFDETISFSLALESDLVPQDKSYTLTSTCVWERDGSDSFTDASPTAGGYLAHRQAWFVEDRSYSGGGYWEVGHPNRPNNSAYDGDECRDHDPVELTNDRNTLTNYVNSLDAGGWTAGHLGVAWTWYLVAEDWKTVFDGDAEPLAYTEPDSAKAVILMTDGSFNAEIYPGQGDSDAQARSLCDNMKAKDVKVYAVALNAPQAGKDVLSDCATGPDYYFEPETAAELTEAYQKIATSISDLRISK
ncbi:MAG: pilus assembly protein TadG-related protein [Hyphomonadaceae bacterium]|nr:pilus assembly protein TadG-related protein [Hyphomonadaceae bacterium]